VKAALEERERLLDELADLYEATARQSNEDEALKSDAALGALVRRIREHPKNRDRPYPIRPFGCDSVFSIDAAGLTAFLAHLDSLLPKEPEVVTGVSGREYRFQPGFVASVEVRHRNADGVATAWEIVSRVPVTVTQESAEAEARAILARLDIPGAEHFSAGDVVELANLVAEVWRLRSHGALANDLNAAPVMESAFVDAAEVLALAPEELRLSVLTPRERAVMRHGEAVYAHNVLLRERWNDFDALEKSDEEIRSSMRALQVLAHDAALTTEDFNE
jgi:hypothetical protein